MTTAITVPTKITAYQYAKDTDNMEMYKDIKKSLKVLGLKTTHKTEFSYATSYIGETTPEKITELFGDRNSAGDSLFYADSFRVCIAKAFKHKSDEPVRVYNNFTSIPDMSIAVQGTKVYLMSSFPFEDSSDSLDIDFFFDQHETGLYTHWAISAKDFSEVSHVSDIQDDWEMFPQNYPEHKQDFDLLGNYLKEKLQDAKALNSPEQDDIIVASIKMDHLVNLDKYTLPKDFWFCNDSEVKNVRELNLVFHKFSGSYAINPVVEESGKLSEYEGYLHLPKFYDEFNTDYPNGDKVIETFVQIFKRFVSYEDADIMKINEGEPNEYEYYEKETFVEFLESRKTIEYSTTPLILEDEVQDSIITNNLDLYKKCTTYTAQTEITVQHSDSVTITYDIGDTLSLLHSPEKGGTCIVEKHDNQSYVAYISEETYTELLTHAAVRGSDSDMAHQKLKTLLKNEANIKYKETFLNILSAEQIAFFIASFDLVANMTESNDSQQAIDDLESSTSTQLSHVILKASLVFKEETHGEYAGLNIYPKTLAVEVINELIDNMNEDLEDLLDEVTDEMEEMGDPGFNDVDTSTKH